MLFKLIEVCEPMVRSQAPNGAMAPTNVPPAFIWRDSGLQTNATDIPGVTASSGKETLVMWWQSECDTMCFQQYPG